METKYIVLNVIAVVLVLVAIAYFITWRCLFSKPNVTSTINLSSTIQNPEYQIVQIAPYHYEVVVGAMHVLFKHNPNITVHVYSKDTLGYIDLYLKQNPTYKAFVHQGTLKKLPPSDGVIFTTSREYRRRYVGEHQPVVRIGHAIIDKPSMDMGMISLSHSNWATFAVEWKIPYDITSIDQTPTVVVIGVSHKNSSKNKDMEDIRRLIKSGTKVAIFSRTIPNNLPKTPNASYYKNKDQNFLINFLQSRNCLIWTAVKPNSAYHKKSMTGAVPTAISCNVPLVMDKKLHRIYDLPALTYNQSILEILEIIHNTQKSDHSIYASFVKQQNARMINILKKHGFRNL